jgi:N-methylhydantoinase B
LRLRSADTVNAERQSFAAAAPGIDPITTEIIRHALCSITDQIDKNIIRTAFSPLIYEYRDFSVGILDPEAQVIAQGRGSLPIFVANALGAAVRDGIEIYGLERMLPGDVIINNHAGSMGQHLNNVVMYTPIYVGERQETLFGFMAILMHWMDVGGGVIGSCFGTQTSDIFQEGIQYRSVKLHSKGEPVEEMYRMIEHNTRFPTMVLGDIASQLAGCFMGRDLTAKLVEKYGLDAVRAAVTLFWAQTEGVARDAIRAIPDGEYRASAFLDDDGITLGEPIPIEIAVRVTGDEIEIDFTDIADQLPGPINAGFNGGAACAARIACTDRHHPGRQVPERRAHRADGRFRLYAAHGGRHDLPRAGRCAAGARQRRASRHLWHPRLPRPSS